MTTTAKRSLGHPSDPADDRVPGSSPGPESIPSPLRAVAAGPVPGPLIPADWSRDRVVSRLVSQGSVDPDQITGFHATWTRTLEDGFREPFWRFVARQDGMDRGRVLRTAAAAYGFSPVRVSLVGTLGLLDYLRSVWPSDAVSRLAAMSAVPVAAEEGSPSARLIIASDDPCNPDLGRLMDALVSGPYELRYASEADLAECFEAVRRHLPDLIPDGLVRLGKVSSSPVSLRRAA